jgi:hypothetical protein
MGRCDRTTTKTRGLNRQRGKGAVHDRVKVAESLDPALSLWAAYTTLKKDGADPEVQRLAGEIDDVLRRYASEQVVHMYSSSAQPGR